MHLSRAILQAETGQAGAYLQARALTCDEGFPKRVDGRHCSKRALRAHEYFLDAAHELAAAAGGVVLCVTVQPWLLEHGLEPAHTNLCPLETDF